MSGAAAALKAARGVYPERKGAEDTGLDRVMVDALGQLGRVRRLLPGRFQEIVGHVDRATSAIAGLSDDELVWQLPALRRELRVRGLAAEAAGKAFAMVREVATRRLGQRHYDVQLVGGWVLLNGMVAEMATGEGKTLSATLPACTAALAGVPVHIVTVNDYLTSRDAEWMRPVYEALGLTVGAVTHDTTPQERRRAYRCDVTYCTNKEVAFDYLRDHLELGRKPGPIRTQVERLGQARAGIDSVRLRGLHFGIVDEADSVLIDEARTPLIIAGPGDTSYEAQLYRQALALSEQLVAEQHYRIDFPKREAVLTDDGRERLEELARPLGGFWSGRLRRQDLVRKALTARHLFLRDRHYLVTDGKVQIVDEYTGRIMPGRSWEGGLHQLIEAKEFCDITTRNEVLARISYQRFFRRYLALAGMTGTAREASSELWSVYRLEVVRVPTHRPMIRRQLSTRLHRTADEKWAAIVERIAEMHAIGRPVLVGTRTVKDSEHLARLLERAGMTFRVLNARQDDEEAEIIARAGERGQITVATNMAGRGTDIMLGDGVAGLGGLHVIATERHDAGRIDRQLFGRCGRQGDPGSYEFIVSLEDDLLQARFSKGLGRVGVRLAAPGPLTGSALGRWIFRAAQRSAEQRHLQARKDLLKIDEQQDKALAFSGTGE